MPRRFIMPALTVMTALLIACGQQPFAQPDIEPGIIFAESAKTRLFTAERDDGLLDFKLYFENRNTGQITLLELPVPSDALVIGAALADETRAFVATRTPTNTGDQDAIYSLDLTTKAANLVVPADPEITAGLELNSLTAEHETLRFFSLRPITHPDGHIESDLTLFRLNRASSQVEQVDSSSAEAAQFKQALQAANTRDLTAQRTLARPQASTPFLRFPKALASRNVPGSPYHTGQDLYALDLNRDSGDTDLNDGVVAAASGQVIQSSFVGAGYGEYIIVRHPNGLSTAYAHLNKRVVTTGSSVYQGQYIGNVGKSGGQTYAHLHFVLRSGTSPLRAASATYPMAADYGGVACPLTSFPNEVNVGPASC
jgi:murein DD-endopeptidase MepM/ murein hydrolase activator NlpD